ncbi:MAG: hypothetical protein ACRDNW_18220 [Trebonia sp.]
MNDRPAPKAPAPLPARTPAASGHGPVNPLERLNDVQLIAARDKLRNRLQHAAPDDHPRRANTAAALGLLAAEITRRTKQAANRQDQPRQ